MSEQATASGLSAGEVRRAVASYGRCGRSKGLRRLHRLIDRADVLDDQIRGFLDDHPGGDPACPCALCAGLDAQFGGWRNDLIAMSSVLQALGSSLESCVPPAPRKLARELEYLAERAAAAAGEGGAG